MIVLLSTHPGEELNENHRTTAIYRNGTRKKLRISTMYREGATSRICLKEKSKRSALKVILKNRRGWCRHRVVVVVFIFVSSPSFLSALPSLINGALKAVEEDEEGSTKPSKSLSHRSRNPRPRAPLITLSYQQPPNDEMPSLL
ncbi:hypothetical protein Droror1_Dr00028058 [Drosera rotundifolia]